jgi:hypothetical protein
MELEIGRLFQIMLEQKLLEPVAIIIGTITLENSVPAFLPKRFLLNNKLRYNRPLILFSQSPED